MSKAKPLNFEGATLKSGGGSISNGVYVKNFWRVELADGTQIQRDYYYSGKNGQYFWKRWWPNDDIATWRSYQGQGSFRKLSDFDNKAVDEWVKAHPDYYEDGTRKYEGR